MSTAIAYDLKADMALLPGYDIWANASGCWFDEELALHRIEFIEMCCTHIEGFMSGRPFLLEPWERAIAAAIFGWQKESKQGMPVRRFREALIYVPRKNGKTPLCAALANAVIFCDQEDGQQNYCAAAEREQASLLYRQMVGMIENEPELSKRATAYRSTKTIAIEGSKSFVKVLSADANTKHGQTSHLVMVDELHAQPNRDLVDVLQTSTASANRLQPLLIHLTTADYDRPSICNEKYDYACKVRDGIIQDQSFLPVVYEAKLEDDWTDKGVWAAANPNLGVSVSEEYLERECKRAQDSPAYENTFKRLHLNIKTEQDVRWLQMQKWDACGDAWGVEEIEGMECWCGLDLSTTTDVSAFAKVFRREGKYLLDMRFWIPASRADIRERRDRVPYSQWIREGWITATDGDVIDYGVIERDIIEDSKIYNIVEIAADPWNATQVLQHLDGEGLVVFNHTQGYAGMSAPSKEFEKAVIQGNVVHNKNPVLRWMASNASAELDAAGNIKPSKKKSTEKIDGIVAAVMAVGRAALGDGAVSWYETNSLETW